MKKLLLIITALCAPFAMSAAEPAATVYAYTNGVIKWPTNFFAANTGLLLHNLTNSPAWPGNGSMGTVTSVGLSSSWLVIGGSPITENGTMTLAVPYTPLASNANSHAWSAHAPGEFALLTDFQNYTNLAFVRLADLGSLAFRATNDFLACLHFEAFSNLLGSAAFAMADDFLAANQFAVFQPAHVMLSNAVVTGIITNGSGFQPAHVLLSNLVATGVLTNGSSYQPAHGILSNAVVTGIVTNSSGFQPANTILSNAVATGIVTNSTGFQPAHAKLTNFTGTGSITNLVNGSTNGSGWVGLIRSTNNGDAVLKTLSAGSNITLTDNGTNIAIAASAGGSANTHFNFGGGELDVVSTSTASNLVTFAVTNGIPPGRTLRVVLQCEYLNNTGANASFSNVVNLGGTVIYQGSSANFTTGASRRPCRLVIEICAKTANTQYTTIDWRAGAITASPTVGAGAFSLAPFNSAIVGSNGETSVDTSTNVTLTVQIVHSSSSASLSLKRHGFKAVVE